jgi:hypothetical protein
LKHSQPESSSCPQSVLFPELLPAEQELTNSTQTSEIQAAPQDEDDTYTPPSNGENEETQRVNDKDDCVLVGDDTEFHTSSANPRTNAKVLENLKTAFGGIAYTPDDPTDPRYADWTEPPKDRKRGGKPPDADMRAVSTCCHPVSMPEEDRKANNSWVQCLASRLCNHVQQHNKYSECQLNHTWACNHFKVVNEALQGKVKARLADIAPSEQANKKRLKEREARSNDDGEPVVKKQRKWTSLIIQAEDDHDSANTNPFASFKAAGKEQYQMECDLDVMLMLVGCGIAPEIVNRKEFKTMVNTISRGAYATQGEETIREKQITRESEAIRARQLAYLRTADSYITISTDGVSNRKQQLIYPVHATTAERRSFLIHGDVSFDSHTAKYVPAQMETGIIMVGAENVIAVVTDDTGNTRKARSIIAL